MANLVTTQTLLSGSRRFVIKFTNLSDGTAETAVTKIDMSALSPVPNELKITQIWYTTVGMSVQLLWDATDNVLITALASDSTGHLDFRSFGGIPNNAGTGVTGDILFTTVGHSSGDFYSIIIEVEGK